MTGEKQEEGPQAATRGAYRSSPLRADDPRQERLTASHGSHIFFPPPGNPYSSTRLVPPIMFSLMDVKIPPLDDTTSQRRGLSRLLQRLTAFGPAAILASLAIGAGETIVVVRAGAWAGYSLMWLVLLSVLVKAVFFTYMLGRYTAISGEHIGHRLVKLPGPRGWLLITIIVLEMLAGPPLWVAIARPCGNLLYYVLASKDGLHLPLSGSEEAWGQAITIAFIILALGMSLRLTYEKLEKQQIVICLILVTGTVLGTLLVRPDIGAAIIGSLRFGYVPETWPDFAPKIATEHPGLSMVNTFGYVGGSIMGYIVYANWVGLRRWGLCRHDDIEKIREQAARDDRIRYLPDDAVQARRLRRLAAPLKWDVGMGAIVLFVVTIAFMMSGAAVLYPMLMDGKIDSEKVFTGWNLLTGQAHVWKNIHESLIWIYYVTVIAALWGTLQAFPEVYARVTHEFCQAIWPKKAIRFALLQRIICVYIAVGCVVLVWVDPPFDILISLVTFLVTSLPVALMMFASIYLNFLLPPRYRTHGIVLAGGCLSAVILTVATYISATGLADKLTGG